MTQTLNELRIVSVPFANPPPRRDYIGVKPELKVEVEYAEWNKDTHLRAPVIKRLILN